MTDMLPSTDVLSMVPQMMDLARQLKGAVGLIPEHLKTEGQILATILAGRELGIGPMAAMRGLHVVRGKVGADYSLWVALLKRNGYSVEWLESSAEKVVLRLTDPKGKQHTETWDRDRATKAGLWGQGDGWRKYPETMLRARAVTSAGRSFAADVMAGGYSMDELEEMKPAEVVEKPRAAPKIVVEEPVAKPIPGRNDPIDPESIPLQLSVEEIVAGMAQAQTMDDLKKWVDQCSTLKGLDKDTARTAYADHRERIMERQAIQSEAS